MKIETKYNLFDTVWHIQSLPTKEWIVCDFCEGLKVIIGKNGKERTCPECSGFGGSNKIEKQGWQVTQKLTIGHVRVAITGKDPIGTPRHSVFSNYGPQEYKHKEEYMCKETGIGSGSVHKVDYLWPTKEEAQKECDRRNKEK